MQTLRGLRTLWILSLILPPLTARAGSVVAVVQDQGGQPVSNAVVYLRGLDPAPPPTEPFTAVVDQIDKEFVPYVSVIRAGTLVHFPNRDNIRHHVYSFSPARTFDLPLYADQPQDPVLFDQPGLVTLGCNIHDWMIGYVLVVDTPWYALTAEGRSRMEDIPAGTYRLHVWHPLLKEKEDDLDREVVLGDTGEETVALTITLKKDWRKPRVAGNSGDY